MLFENEASTLLTNEFGDQYFHDINGSAFNKVGAEALYKKHFAEKLNQENTLYIILGTDSGLLPKYLQGVGLPVGTRYLFVELPEVLQRLGEVTPEEGFDSRIIITTPSEWSSRAGEIHFQNYVFLGLMEFHRSISAEDLHLEGYQECGLQLQEELEQLRWQTLATMGSDVFNRLQLENLAENRTSAACLEDSFKGKTAVILGGGPSLDKALPWIAQNRDRLVVIAVSRIARRLLEVQMTPDIFVSIDPHQVSFDISKEMLQFWEHTLFVHLHHVSSKLLGQWRGRSLYLGPRFSWPTPWNDEQMAGRGPTVTNCAINLAVKMGVSQLLLTGVDLCFSKEGFTHAKGSNEHQAGPQLGQGQLWVETNGGWFSETTADFHFAITTIAQQAQNAEENSCHIYNLSADAAKIPGVDFCDQEKTKLDPLPQSAFQILENHLPEDSPETRRSYYHNMISELDRAASAFKDIKSLSKEALKANAYFSGKRGNAKGNPAYRKKIDKIEKKLNNKYPDFIRLLKHVGIRDFIKIIHGEQDREWDEKDVGRLMQSYYDTYIDSASRMLDMVKKTRKRLLSRLEEEEESPDFDMVIEQWEEDEQPGRSLVWKVRHGKQNVPDTFLDRFSDLENKFTSVLEETETLHMARAKAWAQLGPVCGKLKLLFKHGEPDGIKHLLTGLGAMDSEDAKVLFQLGSGFLAELTEDFDSALNAYQLTIDQLSEEKHAPILEEALLRIFVISLNREDTDNAMLAVNCLSAISPVYLPYQADLRRLTGDKNGALDIYAQYLEKVPTDTSAMLKLGRLYLEMGIKEGAKLMSDSVLALAPGNKAALQLLSDLDGIP